MTAASSIIFSASALKHNNYAQKNYGVYRVATEFRNQGISCQVVQFFNFFNNLEILEIVDKFSDDLKIVGFSTLFWEHYDRKSKEILIDKVNFLIKYIRQEYPHVTILAGGPSCRIFLNKEFENVDAIFDGFSENTFVPYIRSIAYREPQLLPDKYVNNTPIYNKISGKFDFNNSSTVYKSQDLITQHDVPILEVGRGCIFKCKFCGFALNGKKKLDYIKDFNCLKRELLYNYVHHGITNYILSDDTFNDSVYKIKELHKVFTSLPFKINFACYLRLDLLLQYPEEISLLKEMGLIGAFFGIESFHKKASRLIGKGIDPEVAKKALQDLKSTHWGNSVKIGVGIITGIPYETYDSIQATKEWIADEKNLVDQVVPFPLSVSNPQNVRPQPWDSEFQKNAEKYGFSWPDGHSYHWHNSIGPVKTRHEAVEIWKDYSKICEETNRQKQGGFNLMKAYPLISKQVNPPSLDDLLEMNRHAYTQYIKSLQNSETISTYVNEYKLKLLKI